MKPKKMQPDTNAPTHEAKCQQAFDANFDCVTNVYLPVGTSSIPFKEILSLPHYREAIYKQFKEANKKPCFRFYSDKIFTQQQINDWNEAKRANRPVSEKLPGGLSIAELESEIKKQVSDFGKLCAAEKVPEDCLLPDIWETTICSKLQGVKSVFERFEESVFIAETNRYKEPEIRAERILQLLGTLDNDSLQNDVIRQIVAYDWNDRFSIEKVLIQMGLNGRRIEPAIEEKWQAMKDYFNTLLTEALPAGNKGKNAGSNSITATFPADKEAQYRQRFDELLLKYPSTFGLTSSPIRGLKTRIPFREVLSTSTYREELYRQFQKAPLVPCLEFYLIKRGISKKEIENFPATCYEEQAPNKGNISLPVSLTSRAKEILDAQDDFLVGKNLTEDCCCPDIFSTPIVRILQGVAGTFEDFKRSVKGQQTDINKEPERRAERILQLLDTLNNADLRNDVIRALTDLYSNQDLDESFTTELFSLRLSNDELEKWSGMKGIFDLTLRKALPPAASQPTTGSNAIVAPLLADLPARKTFSHSLDYPLCACIKGIEEKYVSIRDKAMAADNADNPGKAWWQIEYRQAEHAMKLYRSQYLIDLLEVQQQPTCTAYQEILSNVENARQKLLSEKKRRHKTSFEKYLKEGLSKWEETNNRCEELIKPSTARLSTLRSSFYWLYLNSFEHTQMYVGVEAENELALPAASQPAAGSNTVKVPPPAGSKEKAPLKLKWLKDWNALMRLIKVLEEEELIPEEKGLTWARNTFYNSAGVPFTNRGTFEPLLWKGKDALLCYLINELEGTCIKKGNKWAWAGKNFIDEEGKAIKKFAQKTIAYKNGHTKKPLDAGMIDPIIAVLKTL